MSESKFHVSVVTSDGAGLVTKAKSTKDGVYLYKAIYIPVSFNRSKAANLNYFDFLNEFGSFVPESSNISAVLSTNSGDGKAGNVFIQCSNSSPDEYIVKSVVILGCLYSEREAPNPVIFAVLSDDNACFRCGGNPLDLSLTLPVSNNMIFLYGENTMPGIDLSGYITQSDLEGKQETSVIDRDGSYSVVQGGFYHHIKNEVSQAEFSIMKENVPVSVELNNNNLVIITQNGNKYTLSGTVTKSNVFDPVDFTAYTNHNNPGVNSSLNGNSGSSPDQKYKLNDANGNYIAYNDALTYTVKGVYKADDTEVTTTGRYILAKSTDNYLCIAKINDGYSWSAARIEYTAE